LMAEFGFHFDRTSYRACRRSHEHGREQEPSRTKVMDSASQRPRRSAGQSQL
jgi:hypothetical protein